MNTTASIMDVLIENITTDQKLLEQVEKKSKKHERKNASLWIV